MTPLGVVSIGGIVSLAVLGFALVVQSQNGSVLELPLRWFWVALVPVGIAMFVGGYVNSVNTPVLTVSGPAEKLPLIGESTAIVEVKRKEDKSDWTSTRGDIYAATGNIVLAHEYRPSDKAGQKFEAYIYLVRHTPDSSDPPSTGFNEVSKAEFYLGKAWGDKVFSVENAGGPIGLRVHAYGTFLAICRLHFVDDRESQVIYRYIDFEMGKRSE